MTFDHGNGGGRRHGYGAALTSVRDGGIVVPVSASRYAPGTCGELMQGVLPDGVPFHVTCPIGLGSMAGVRLAPANEWSFTGADRYTKMYQAIYDTASLFTDQAFEVAVIRRSELDTGKGMGSSTADVVAASRATAAALGVKLSPDQEAWIATGIESSDGSMHPGLTVMNHKTGQIVADLPWWPRFIVVMTIPGQSVDTDQVDMSGREALAGQYQAKLDDLETASRRRDGAVFGRVATWDAQQSQTFCPTPGFDQMQEAAAHCHADGLCVAHAGTVSGLLFLTPGGMDRTGSETAMRRAESAATRLRKHLPDTFRVVSTFTPAMPKSALYRRPGTQNP